MVNTNVNTIGINGKVFSFPFISRRFMENSSNLVRRVVRSLPPLFSCK